MRGRRIVPRWACPRAANSRFLVMPNEGAPGPIGNGMMGAVDRPLPDARHAVHSTARESAAAVSAYPAPHGAEHVIAYRASIPFLGGRYYVAFFVGREQRAPERQIVDRQRKSWWQTTVGLSALAIGLSTMFMCLVATAYLVKSLLGVDLLDDHFFLHGLFFN